MYIGLTTHKNDLGQVAMILGLVFLYNILKNYSLGQKQNIYDFVFIGMTLWILIGPITPYDPRSQNKTSVNSFLISSLLMILYMLFLKRNPRRLNMFVIIAPIAFIVAYLSSEAFYGKNIFELMVHESGREMTLAGRTDLWRTLVDIGSRDPVLGKGFGGFWMGQSTPGIFEKISWKATTGHNGYLDVFVDLGIVGLIILSAVIISNYRKITRLMIEKSERATFLIIYLCCIMFHNLTESSFIKPTNILWFIFLLISLMPVKTYMYNDDSENIDGANAFFERAE
jgi:O-antigen ligase